MAYIGAGITRFNTADQLTVTGDATIDTTTLVVDSTNNRVGVGTASPSNPFQVGTSDLIVDSSGKVGIGATSPQQLLHINGGAADTAFQITNSASGSTATDGFSITVENPTPDVVLRNRESSNMRFLTANTERMRLDSSGNLLVGKTSASVAVEGAELRPTGQAILVADGTNPILMNRLTSDGDIAVFRKDGTTVGSIGTLTASGVALQIKGAVNTQPVDVIVKNSGGSDIAYRFHDSIGFYGPDATQNLGRSTGRWKDLYLSGGVYLGGTGAANKLDDYEEGTWTPAVTYGTINSSGGIYTKIGRVVHCAAVFDTVSDTSNGNAFEISGLPFDADPNGYAWGSSMWKYNGSGKHICYISSSNKVYFYNGATGGGYSNLTHSQLTSGAGAHIFFTYTTSA